MTSHSKALVSQEYQRTDEWESLIEESRAIISETKFNAHMELVQGKHLLGKRVAEDPLYQKYSKGNQSFLGDVARAIGISKTELYYCVRFYLKFPEFTQACKQLPEEKTITWRRMKMLLPNPDGCTHTTIETEKLLITRSRCVSCGRVLNEVKEKYD